MRKSLLLIPAALLAVVCAVAMFRSTPSVEGPKPAVRKGAAPVPEVEEPPVASAATKKAAAPAVREMTPEEKGIVFDRVALRNQVSIYVSAALRKDEITAKAMRDSLARRSSDSRSVVQERQATARGAEEKKVLSELLGYLR